MADRRVTHAVRDKHGDILALCNPDEDWKQRRKEWIIQDIQEDRHRYFVDGLNDSERDVQVVDGPTGLYLRTIRDSIEENNLDDLSDELANPWEVVHEDAEILVVHAALIPHGQGLVLLMGGDEHDKSNADNGEIHNTRFYNAIDNSIVPAESPEADAFCCGHAFLSDGRLLVGGGTEQWNDAPTMEDEEGVVVDNPEGQADQHLDMHLRPRNHWSGAKTCSILDPSNLTLDPSIEEETISLWPAAADMLPDPDRAPAGGGRWYPTLLTLADGRVLAVAGHPSLSDGRHGTWMPEIYDPATDEWSYAGGHWIYVAWADVPVVRELNVDDGQPTGDPILDDSGNLRELREFPEGQTRPSQNADDNFNYLYYPRLFTVAGGRVFMASPNNNNCGWYDPNTGLIDELLLARPPHGGGYAETNHTAVLMPLLPGDDYTPHILFMGYEGPHRISLDDSDPDNPPSWQAAGIRDWPEGQIPLRRHGCATLLPTGEVIFSGGINHDNRGLEEDEPGSPDGDTALAAEIYTPKIDWDSNTYDFDAEDGESWATTPQPQVVRNYHSVALLLPNGQIFTAGSNRNASSGGDGVKEYFIEIYSPWYDGDPDRAVISDAPAQIGYGEVFSFNSSDADSIERIALMRCGTVTHAWDGDQRYVALEFEHSDNSNTLNATAPPDGGVAPPGPYMLWVIDSSGRPCQAAPFIILA